MVGPAVDGDALGVVLDGGVEVFFEEGAEEGVFGVGVVVGHGCWCGIWWCWEDG